MWLLLALLVTPGLAWAQADFGRDPAPAFELGSYRAGESPAHALGFSVFRGELETYRAVITYPAGFRFNGFDALGPGSVEVGTLMLDVDADGSADHAVPLRSLSAGLAYADVIADGRFSPQVEPTLRHRGDALVLRLPLGGDADRSTVAAVADARVTLVLLAGLISNPGQAGAYVIGAELVSVDPDTDDADDGAGAPPLALAFEVPVPIHAPALVPFAALCVDRAEAARVHSLQGRFRLGPASDGIDLARESVAVTFGEFQQEVPGAAFSAVGQAFVRFSHPGPGVTLLELGPRGLFRLEVRGVGPGAVDTHRPVPFALRIGDDRGETLLALDRHGHLRHHRPCKP